MLIEHPFNQAAKKLIKQSFLDSKIILYPTETLMALGCLMDDEIAVDKLFKLKKRPLAKALLMISNNWHNVLPWVEELSDKTIAVFESLNKHPLTIALPSQHFVVKFLNPFGKNLAFRVTTDPSGSTVSNCHKIPASEFARKRQNINDICKQYKKLLIALQGFNKDIIVLPEFSHVTGTG